MENKWTEKQLQAIEERNVNLLVSAAAGSGKTAVLVERIKRMVLNGECSLKNMLIVTFTNAAASEMKEKIENSLKKAIRESDDEDEIVRLKEELDNSSSANISTFHAFCLDVIRRYFYLIKVEPNFKILDETQAKLMKEESLSELLSLHYESYEKEYIDFLNKYSSLKNDEKLRGMISDTYELIQSLPNPISWLENEVENLKVGNQRVFIEIFDSSLRMIDEALKGLNDNRQWAEAENLTNSLELIDDDLRIANNIKTVLEKNDFNMVRDFINNFKLKSMNKKYYEVPLNSSLLESDVKERIENARDSLKSLIKTMKESYFYASLEELKEEMASTYSDCKYLLGLVKEYDAIFKEKKAEKGVSDFSDIEHFAYEILLEKEASDYYRTKFEYIYIDEYQDSNIIQDALISRIKRDNNLFMVGDIKQSIYKFRLAKPEIFKEKYYRYENEKESKRIDLNKNFRSKSSVINFINLIFENLMDGYDNNQKLYEGDENASKLNFEPRLYLANLGWDNENLDDIDDEIKNLRKAEKEALATTKIIKDYLGKPFFDSKQNKERPLELKDIVILMRGIKGYGEEFYRILTNNGIPTYIDDNDGFFNTIEINLVMSLLSVIDNEKQDIPLLTLMRSNIFNYSTEEMIKVRLLSKDGSYYSALLNYSLNGEEPLKSKCIDTLEKIKEYRQYAEVLPLEELIWKLTLETGIYVYMGTLPGGTQRQANLRALADKALDYRKNGNSSLYGFMKYIEAIKDGKVKMGQVKLIAEGDNTVRMMTIHKSKGLEFPMVILAGYAKKLNYDSVGKSVAIHDELGIGLPQTNHEGSWYKRTIVQNVIKERIHKEQVEEEERVLYVALTRAKDILAIVGILDEAENTIEKIKNQVSKDTSYLTMTGKDISKIPGALRYIRNDELLGISKGKKRSQEKVLKALEESKKYDKEIDKLMSYSYGNTLELNTKSKYSVTELNRKASDEIELREPNIGDEKQLSSKEIGIITHKVLELLDFKEAIQKKEEYLDSLLKKMVSDEHILESHVDAIDKEAILNLVNSKIGSRISNSPFVFKEQAFNLKMKVNSIDTLVQGVIDCYFVESDSLVLLDYKTSGIKDEEELRRTYSKQIEIYKEALKKAKDMPVKEAYLYVINQGKLVNMQ